MEIQAAIRARRSIRKFKSGAEIPKKDIEQMLEAAMMAPSAINSRPWEFVVVKSRKVREEMAAVHPFAKMLPSASFAVVVCARPGGLPSAVNGYWPQDCGAAIENLLLEAVGLGYGAVWCGIYPSERRVKVFSEMLELTSIPVAVISVGVPEEAPAARGFFDPAKVRYIE